MKEKDIHSELASIRSLMERSTRFISLSGLSGVLAGVYALVGSFIGYQLLYRKYGSLVVGDTYQAYPVIYHQLFILACTILLLSIITGIWLTIRQAKKQGEPYWNPVSRRLVTSMAIPLATGGVFILILLFRAEYELIASACLLFYGLSLVTASNHTFSDVRWLGFSEIILGLCAAWYSESGFLFWVIGFGLLHILYGSVMHFKYNR